MPRVPRCLGVRRSERKRIARELSGLPQTEPEVAVTLSTGEEHVVAYDPCSECSLPLAVGACGFYADYDAVTHERLEATAEWRRRWVRYRGTRYLDTYEAGGSWNDDEFHLSWRYRRFHHPTPASIQTFSEWDSSVSRRSRCIRPDVRVQWLDPEHCSGPQDGGSLFAGTAVVRIGSRTFDCVRAIDVRPDAPPGQDELEPDEPAVLWGCLDDVYLTRGGRVVLARRFKSRESFEWDVWSGRNARDCEDETWDEWSAGRSRIVYNGVEFAHFFDILTDASLGWPSKPPFR